MIRHTGFAKAVLSSSPGGMKQINEVSFSSGNKYLGNTTENMANHKINNENGNSRFLFLYDLTSQTFTTPQPYPVTKSTQWDWQRSISVMKDCPVLLQIRVTARNQEEAKVKALYLVASYLQKQ